MALTDRGAGRRDEAAAGSPRRRDHGAGVVRSLGKARLYPHLVCEPGDFAARSRWVRGRTLELEDTLDIASLVRELTASRLESAVLIPCTDPWCHGVVELPESAMQRYPTSMPSRETVELLLDKWLLSRKLEELGVPHPATYELPTRRSCPMPRRRSS